MDDLRRIPRTYNAPLIKSAANLALASAFSQEIYPAENNARGVFLSEFTLWGYRDQSNLPGVGLYVARYAVPNAIIGVNVQQDIAQYLAFSRAHVGQYVSPDFTAWTIGMDYRPPRPKFIAPGYGVYLASYAAISAVWYSGEFYFDIDQAGR